MQRESQPHSVTARSFVNMLFPPTSKTRQVRISFQKEDYRPVSSPSSSASTVLTDRRPQVHVQRSVAQIDRRSWQPREEYRSEIIQLVEEKMIEDILSSISKFILLVP